MGYTKQQFLDALNDYGELFIVLESDREYEVHGEKGFEYVERDGDTFVKIEGKRGDEWLMAEFKLDDIEHHYSHKEV